MQNWGVVRKRTKYDANTASGGLRTNVLAPVDAHRSCRDYVPVSLPDTFLPLRGLPRTYGTVFQFSCLETMSVILRNLGPSGVFEALMAVSP